MIIDHGGHRPSCGGSGREPAVHGLQNARGVGIVGPWPIVDKFGSPGDTRAKVALVR